MPIPSDAIVRSEARGYRYGARVAPSNVDLTLPSAGTIGLVGPDRTVSAKARCWRRQPALDAYGSVKHHF